MINWIEKIEPNFFKELKNTSHNYKDHTNPWHLEADGNVYGHTLMVYNEAIKQYPDDDILQLGALLHDIGKPICKEDIPEKNRSSFFSHENIGVFLAVDILKKLDLNENDVIRVLQIIQRHADSYKLSLKNLKKLYSNKTIQDTFKIRLCDTLGRISENGNEEDLKNLEDTKKVDFGSFEKPEQKNNTITLLIGPPASGKSTYLKNYNGIIISRDECLMSLSDKVDYSDAWKCSDQKEVDKLFEKRLRNVILARKDFIVDMTNINVKSRRKFIERLKNKYNIEAKVFLNSLDTLLTRNSLRTNKTLNNSIIIGMCKRFQMPYEGEGFSDIEYII